MTNTKGSDPAFPGHRCADGCQYAKDVDMWPEHRCVNGCKYDEDAAAQAVWDEISPLAAREQK